MSKRVREMRLFRSVLCGLLIGAFLFSAGSVNAEFCKGLTRMEAPPEEGKVWRADITARLSRFRLLPDASAEVLTGLLPEAVLRLEAGKDYSGIHLLFREREALCFTSRETENGTEILLNGLSVQESGEGMPILDGAALWDDLSVTQVLSQAPERIREAEESLPEACRIGEKKEDVVLSHIGRTHLGRHYALSKEEAEGFLEAVTALSEKEPMLRLCIPYFEKLSFSERTTLWFRSNEEGTVCSLEMDGMVFYDGQECSLSFMTAAGRQGVSLSVNLKPAEGKDQFRLSGWLKCSEQETNENDLNGTLELRKRVGAEKLNLTAECDLNCKSKNGVETVTGRVQWTENRGSRDSTWIIQPELVFDALKAAGEVEVKHRVDESGDITLTLGVSLSEAEMEMPAVTADAVLAGSETFNAELMRALAGMMLDLEKSQRDLLTHDLCSSQWHDIAPVMESDDDFDVVE